MIHSPDLFAGAASSAASSLVPVHVPVRVPVSLRSVTDSSDWRNRVMTPDDMAAWDAACVPEFDAIAADIVRRVEQGELSTFGPIEWAIALGIDRSRLVQPAWLAEMHRALPSAFEFDQAALESLAAMMRERTAPDAVRSRLERAIPTHYRSPTPIVVRALRAAPHRIAFPTGEALHWLIASSTPAELDTVAAKWLSAILQADYEHYVTCLVDHIALDAVLSDHTTPAMIDRTIGEAVARCPLTQPEWIAAYVPELPGHPPAPATAAIERLTNKLRRSLPNDVRSQLANRLAVLYQHKSPPRPGP